MDKAAEDVCRRCHKCQVVDNTPQSTPMRRSRLPTQAWQDCSADLMGPLPSGEDLLVIVDYYSRYFETVVLKSVTSAKIIEALKPIFARWGFPCSLRTDNGPQFVSEEFQQFLLAHGIEHRSIPPYWPQANGEVERQNRSLLKSLRIAAVKGIPWQDELYRFLIAYRSTPHSTTGKTPFEMMCGRPMKTKLPSLPAESLDEAELDVDWSRKLSDKAVRNHLSDACSSTPLSAGDKVLIRNQTPSSKLAPAYHPKPATVISREGEEVRAQREDGSVVRRHSSHLKRYHQPEHQEDQSNASDQDASADCRPTRNRRPPSRWKDYVV